MKGIILAGGSGTRLYPLTVSTSKQLLPVYDKPMVFYPLSTLMTAGIRDILLISTPSDVPRFENLLGDGSDFGIRVSYAVQEHPDGIAQALSIGSGFIGDEPCALVLGDNIFHGEGLKEALATAKDCAESGKAAIFGFYADDPRRYGVVEIGADGKPLSIVEKPSEPRSHYCVTGLYFYPPGVSANVSTMRPSPRNELEITDLNNIYLKDGNLDVVLFDRRFRWWDAGTFDSLMDAADAMRDAYRADGKVHGSPEAAAYLNGWISKEKLREVAARYGKSHYGEYLAGLAGERLGTIAVEETGIEGLKIIEPKVFADGRGYFFESYNRDDFERVGLRYDFVQDNESRSCRGVLRGLHYQKAHPQAKLVRAVLGEVFDVAVDLRSGSPTFGRWFGVVLSEENKRQLLIPRGFAHGFEVLSETAVFCYKCDDFYRPEDEGGIAWNDPDLGIEWPELSDIKLSEKDSKNPPLRLAGLPGCRGRCW